MVKNKNANTAKTSFLGVKINPRDIEAYAVTKPEMDVLGSTNLLTNIFINATTLFAGAFLGSIAGVIGVNVSVVNWVIFYGSLGLAVIFCIFAILCGVISSRTKLDITKL